VPGFEASGDELGARLDAALARRLDLSRAAAQRLIESGAVTVGGRRAAKSHVLRAGDAVAYETPPPTATVLAAEDVPYRLVYEDDDLLVVDKPAGVVVHPAPGHEHGTLVQGLIARGIAGGHESRPGVVHRLDRDTSGLLIVARTAAAHRRLVDQMARREIARRYVALVVGDLPHDDATIDAPLGRHVRDRTRMSLHTTRPRRAVTHVTVRRRLAGFSLLDVRLETGRTHQIRVHLAALGHPVAGDVVYGSRRRPPGLDRQFLHAAHLELRHPVSGAALVFDAPLPDDLAGFLAALDRAAAPDYSPGNL